MDPTDATHVYIIIIARSENANPHSYTKKMDFQAPNTRIRALILLKLLSLWVISQP
jgi:hypothetical protein